MRVLFAAAEAVPLVKVGGLGDVAGSLPQALRAAGHDVRLVLPRYRGIDADGWEALPVRMGRRALKARFAAIRRGGVPVYLIDRPTFFDRPRVYGYADDGKRFGFFAKAIVDLLDAVDFTPDVLHVHDWHTALAPLYLRRAREDDEDRASLRSLLTVHNLAYQGTFPASLATWLGLTGAWEREALGAEGGQVNYLRAGLVAADRITTVSPTYAREIRSKALGAGLHRLLRRRRGDLTGILNGIDTQVWDPATDRHLPVAFDARQLARKASNREALRWEVGLRSGTGGPLIGMVARLTEQKGIDILLPALRAILRTGSQLVVLGTGERRYERALARRAERRRDLAVVLGYDEALAHRIYGGADAFLMPSRFEPCGLGQLIALRYGTVPIVRATGGLADTVVDATRHRRGNGFAFRAYTPGALVAAVRRAANAYRDPPRWRTLQRRGMAQDVSWEASGKGYANLYRDLAGG